MHFTKYFALLFLFVRYLTRIMRKVFSCFNEFFVLINGKPFWIFFILLHCDKVSKKKRLPIIKMKVKQEA
jgi:hypothetical protein